MDINKLSHAVAVAREGSFSSAATVIPMSQSALTRSIQSLEREYGVKLFERRKNGTSLTREGADFIAAAEGFLRNAERTDEQLQAISSGDNVMVRFGAGPVMTARILPDVLTRLADIPSRFDIRIGSNASLRSLLSRGEIDFFLGGTSAKTDNFNQASGFHFDPILATEHNSIRIVTRANHPLAAGPLERKRLAEFPTACESFMKDMLGPQRFDELGLRKPSVEIDDYHVLAQLTSQTDYVTITNWDVERLRSPGELVGRTLISETIAGEWWWGFVSSKRVPLSATARSVIDVIRLFVVKQAPSAGFTGTRRVAQSDEGSRHAVGE